MRNFSIKELENFSGVKAHTIRMWEKRYSIVTPQRNNSNTRHYSLKDVQRLLDIAFLNRHGFKISQLAKMPGEKINQKIDCKDICDECHTIPINKLIVSMFACNIEDFETVLDKCVESLGLNRTIEQVIIPFLEKVNILSYKDSSCEVHFMVTAIRKKIILGIEKAACSGNVQKTAVMFLPSGEHYDLMLLYMTYVVKSLGLKTLYLGTNVSAENIISFSENKKPDCLYTYMIPGKSFKHDKLTDYLRNQLPLAKLFIATGNNRTDTTKPESNVNYLHYKNVHETVREMQLQANA